MTDYQPLLSRAVTGLGKSTGEARRSLYERARSALVAQLRSVDPPLSESDITRERLSLEEAIRKVEAEAARKSRVDARAEPRFEPRPLRQAMRPATPQAAPPSVATPGAPPPFPPRTDPPEPFPAEMPPATLDDSGREGAPKGPANLGDWTPGEPSREASPASARNRLLNARMPSLRQEGLKGLRHVVTDADELGAATAKASQSARQTRDSYEPAQRRTAPDLPPSSPDRFDPNLDAEGLHSLEDETLHPRSLEPAFAWEDDAPVLPPTRPRPPHPSEDGEYRSGRPPRSYRGMIKAAVLLAALGALAAIVSWQWPHVSHYLAQMRTKPPTQTAQTPTPEPKFSGRVPQEQSTTQAPSSTAPGSQPAAPTVAQRVVLYEEDPNDPQGKRYVGTAVWRTETVSPGPGLAPELAVRADIAIPERHVTVTWSLRRNTDPALPASHTIEIMFNLPPDFPGGGISNVPGILMKQAEQARGTPLAGLAVKVTTNFFLIGLSAVDADQQRNIQLLKEMEWFDIPVVYTNGGRAIMAVEKGPPGDKAFLDAFAAWGK